MALVRFNGGRTYTGWRSVPWLVLFLPLWLPWLAFAVVLSVLRWITGQDRIWGFTYVGNGTWSTQEWR